MPGYTSLLLVVLASYSAIYRAIAIALTVSIDSIVSMIRLSIDSFIVHSIDWLIDSFLFWIQSVIEACSRHTVVMFTAHFTVGSINNRKYTDRLTDGIHIHSVDWVEWNDNRSFVRDVQNTKQE